MGNFLSQWKKDVTETYKKRSWLSKITDFIVFILIAVIAVLYLYHNITGVSSSGNRQQSDFVTDRNNNIDNDINDSNGFEQKSVSPEKELKQEKRNQSIFKFFRIGMIDIVIVIVTIRSYLYIKYCQASKRR